MSAFQAADLEAESEKTADHEVQGSGFPTPCPDCSNSSSFYLWLSSKLATHSVYFVNTQFCENFNIVARTTLAQPILKTEYDKYMFRVKFDF